MENFLKINKRVYPSIWDLRVPMITPLDGKKDISILAGNLNSGLSYLITTVMFTYIYVDTKYLLLYATIHVFQMPPRPLSQIGWCHQGVHWNLFTWSDSLYPLSSQVKALY